MYIYIYIFKQTRYYQHQLSLMSSSLRDLQHKNLLQNSNTNNLIINTKEIEWNQIINKSEKDKNN